MFFFWKTKKTKKKKQIINNNLVIFGFIRENFDENITILIFSIFPVVLTELVIDYVIIRIDSMILSEKEEKCLIHLLNDKLQSNFTTELLYRASEHNFNSNKFHEKCDEKGSTIVIVKNTYNHVYGGYSKVSWNKKLQTRTDPNAFLWCVRPKVKIFELKSSEKDGKQAMWNYQGYGPLYGRGNDLWITDKCNNNNTSGYGSGQSYNCNGSDYGATGEMLNNFSQCYSSISEYEVFKIN